MATFAHIETGTVRDARDADSVDAYRALFSGINTSAWKIVAVAAASAQGTAISLAATPLELSGTAFHALVAGALAQANGTSITAAQDRFGDIILAMRGAGGRVAIAYERYQAAGVPGGRYNFADVQSLLAALKAASIANITDAEIAAITGGWPKAAS